MVGEICPTTGEKCKYRLAMEDVSTNFVANKSKQQASFDQMRATKTEYYIEQAERMCDEAYCGIDLLATVLAVKRHVAHEIADEINSR